MPESIRERGVLRVGTAGEYQPMSCFDPATGTCVGFDAELAEDLAAPLIYEPFTNGQLGVLMPKSKKTGEILALTE